MLLADPVFTVGTTELLEVGNQGRRLVRPVLTFGDADQGAEKAAALHIHRGREHGPDLCIHEEQLAVEIRHCRVSGLLEQKE